MKATSPFASDEEYASRIIRRITIISIRDSPMIVVNEHSPIARAVT